MLNFTDLASVPSHPLAPFTDRLRLAVAGYLARFKGSSRRCTESDLRSYLAWCTEHGLDPLAAQRSHLELYIRSMQEIRRLKPSTVSRRFSVTAGFYRTCVIDGILDHSPAEHVRRPSVPAGSPKPPASRPPGHTRTCSATPTSPPCKGAELHQMQHSGPGVRRLQQGLRRYGAAAGSADTPPDTPWIRGYWLVVALDDRMWRPDRLGWVTG
jgi:hypothetical protein